MSNAGSGTIEFGSSNWPIRSITRKADIIWENITPTKAHRLQRIHTPSIGANRVACGQFPHEHTRTYAATCRFNLSSKLSYIYYYTSRRPFAGHCVPLRRVRLTSPRSLASLAERAPRHRSSCVLHFASCRGGRREGREVGFCVSRCG